MVNEPTIQDVLSAIQSFSSGMDRDLATIRSEMATKKDLAIVQQDVSVLKQDVSVLKQDVSVLKQDVAVLKQDVSVLKYDVFHLKGDVSKNQDSIFLLQQDMTEVKNAMATKEDLEKLKSEIVTEIDGLAVMYKRFDVELVALRSRCERTEALIKTP